MNDAAKTEGPEETRLLYGGAYDSMTRPIRHEARRIMHHDRTRARWRWLGVTLAILVVTVAQIAAVAPELPPFNPNFNANARTIAAAVIFTASYLALAIGKIPGLWHRPGGRRAGRGAGLMVAAGPAALPIEDAYKAIDLDTIMPLLLGMMIVVANLRLSGFFAAATAWVVDHARRPDRPALAALVTATSGFFSAFLVNDAICLVLAPLVLELTQRMGRKPLPFLLAVAMASNVGSAATITGNPQNIMIGSFSQIPYARFALALGPVTLIGLCVTAGLIALLSS